MLTFISRKTLERTGILQTTTRATARRNPTAPIGAARRALDAAGIALDDVAAIKTHNPFAVNDAVFCRETGADVDRMNNYGCSLIWGHPQGPTGMRASSTATTRNAYTRLWDTSAQTVSRRNNPASRSKPQHEPVRPKGPTPDRVNQQVENGTI